MADFAMGKLYDSNHTLTSVNSVAWAAPELISPHYLGEYQEQVSPASAVFSFGIILWEVSAKRILKLKLEILQTDYATYLLLSVACKSLII